MNRLFVRSFKSVVSIALTLGLLLSPGCTLGNSTTTNPTGGTLPPVTTTSPIPPTTTAPPVTVPTNGSFNNYVEVYSAVKASVVAVQSRFGTGTGWIYEASGIIITNHHVIVDSLNAAGQMIFAPRISLADGRSFAATNIAHDERTDLAVVYIGTDLNLPAMTRGDSRTLSIGEPVAAIGHPLGEPLSLKGGWVSALNAEIIFDGGSGLYGLIETDAAINPGNSGGPLVNMAGNVIGITSAKLVDVGVEGVGYAISIHSAQSIINELIANGVVVRPRLGASATATLPPLVSVNVAIANRYSLKVNQGVMVASITPGAPFEKAGVQARDVITHFNGIKVNNVDELQVLLYQKRPGDTATFTINRSGTVFDLNVTFDLLVE